MSTNTPPACVSIVWKRGAINACEWSRSHQGLGPPDREAMHAYDYYALRNEMPIWDELDETSKGELTNSYLDGFQSAMANRVTLDVQPFQPTPSPSDKELLVEAREALRGYQKALSALFMGPYRADEKVAEGLLTAQNIGASTLQKLQSATR